MKTFKSIILFSALLLLMGCSGVKVSKTVLKMIVAASTKENKTPCYADSCGKRIGVSYAEDLNPSQVVDIYYADPSIRKDAVLIDIHGGFYVGGTRVNNRPFASVFLKEGFDVVLVEYRLNDGKTDVSDELRDCAAALDYLTSHAEELGLNKDRMFLTGDSAGGHLALYMAEGSEDRTLPIHPGPSSGATAVRSSSPPAQGISSGSSPLSSRKIARRRGVRWNGWTLSRKKGPWGTSTT